LSALDVLFLESRCQTHGLRRLSPVTPLSLAEWELLVAAPFIGSFVGVVIDRLPDGIGLVFRRSHCGQCATALTACDLVPLASWLVARGRCRHCEAWLGWFYPSIELAALVIALMSLTVDRGADAWIDAALGWWLLALAWIDWRRFILPDRLTLPLTALGIAAAWALAPGELASRTIGAVCGYFGFRVIAWIYRRLRGREGLGGGDAKLLAASGAWVGVAGLPSVVAGAALMGIVAAGWMKLAGSELDRHSAVPLGPGLAAATWLVWLYGPVAF
jgi:leader peptidase (prepilin peptidase) / N-methyltransferase